MAELFHFLCIIQFVHGRLYLIPDVEYPILGPLLETEYVHAQQYQITG